MWLNVVLVRTTVLHCSACHTSCDVTLAMGPLVGCEVCKIETLEPAADVTVFQQHKSSYLKHYMAVDRPAEEAVGYMIGGEADRDYCRAAGAGAAGPSVLGNSFDHKDYWQEEEGQPLS